MAQGQVLEGKLAVAAEQEGEDSKQVEVEVLAKDMRPPPAKVAGFRKLFPVLLTTQGGPYAN
jgi:hypothetical protein